MKGGTSPLVWHRDDAIARLRASFLAITDEDHSLCQVAASRGIFCRGFHRWPEAEFDRRWRTHIGRSTHLSREQMEEYANLWELAEQIRSRVSLTCDAQTAAADRAGMERVLERGSRAVLLRSSREERRSRRVVDCIPLIHLHH